ncbi:TetR/AcrR family transcriptional regulator [Promicromonospora sp. NPDC060271]|uniref:TetR/AcrR family transcriptional regulator n=1 Tax=Promicromonospora sp. NPDC060271 TaxID=3347089 RepID=UPI0036685B00
MPGSEAAAEDAGGTLVRTAIGLADAEGLGGLTLRVLAHHAEIALPEVRRAFGSRDRLVAAMVQHLLAAGRAGAAGRAAAPSDGGPVGTLTRLAEDEWAAYRAHPWLVSVLATSRPLLVPAVLEAARATIEAFVELGFDPQTALGRYIALNGYVQGMALLLLAEHKETARSGTAYRAWWSQEARRLDRTGARRRHTWLDGASGGRLPDAFDAEVDSWFREGLAGVVAGLVTPEGWGGP